MPSPLPLSEHPLGLGQAAPHVRDGLPQAHTGIVGVPDGGDTGYALTCWRHQWASRTVPLRSWLDAVICPDCYREAEGDHGRTRYRDLHGIASGARVGSIG